MAAECHFVFLKGRDTFIRNLKLIDSLFPLFLSEA